MKQHKNFARSRVIGLGCIGAMALLPGMAMAVDYEFAEKAAINFAIDKNYKAAFDTIKEAILDAQSQKSVFIVERGFDFLAKRQLIANEAIADLTFSRVAEVTCQEGSIDKGVATLNERYFKSRFSEAIDPPVLRAKQSWLQAFKERYEKAPDACAAITADAKDVLAREAEAAADLAKVEERVRLEAAAEAKKKLMERTKAAPKFIRDLSEPQFCVAFGHALRGDIPSDLEGVSNLESLFKADAGRRKLGVDVALAKKESFRVGSTECTLFAAFGLPNKTNRTAGPWGVHYQYVYGGVGGTYVYVQNGRVTSFQD